VAAAKKPDKCHECGAELRLGLAPCPLCGAEQEPEKSWAVPVKAVDPDYYQASVRELREQLKKLRDEGAEAV
jgi:hypothetical protein